MTPRQWRRWKQIDQREPDAELADGLDQTERQCRRSIVEKRQQQRTQQLEQLRKDQNCDCGGRNDKDKPDAPDPKRGGIDRYWLDPADREQDARHKTEKIEMCKRA